MSSEAAFLQMVRDLAALRGWYAYHTHDSRRSEPGFPDLVLVKDRRLIFAELKSDTGRLTDRQEDVLGKLGGVPGVEVYVWRPVDFQRIDEVLR